jgi:hypothetical protein
MNESAEINEIRTLFSDLGCLSEKCNDSYFAMEVLANNDYREVKNKLNVLLGQGIIDYAEPCLSDIHRGQIHAS